MSKEVNFYSSSVRILYSLIFKPSDELIKESINNNGTSEANELDKPGFFPHSSIWKMENKIILVKSIKNTKNLTFYSILL